MNKLIFLTLFVVLSAGCLSAEMTTKVNKDLSGTTFMTVKMPLTIYTMAATNNQDICNIQDDPFLEGSLTSCTKEFVNDNVIVNMTISYENLSAADNFTTTIVNDHLTLKYNQFIGQEYTYENVPIYTLKYVVEMPGKITNSNADSVDGNTATWINPTKQVFVECDIPKSIPGFEAILFVICLILINRFK